MVSSRAVAGAVHLRRDAMAWVARLANPAGDGNRRGGTRELVGIVEICEQKAVHH
jgi:hypothetical protein